MSLGLFCPRYGMMAPSASTRGSDGMASALDVVLPRVRGRTETKRVARSSPLAISPADTSLEP